MTIPAFDSHGLLPRGVYDCTFDQLEARFAWNNHRKALLSSFKAFLRGELRPLFPDPVIFDGSFVTDKDLPDDTDMVLDLQHAPDGRKWQGLLFRRTNQDRVAQQYHVHFWIDLPGMNNFTAFFQYVGIKTAQVKGLEPKHHKGVLRLS